MSNNDSNNNQKTHEEDIHKSQRISLDEVTYTVLQNDHLRFRNEYTEDFTLLPCNRKTETSFLAKIMYNYLMYINKMEQEDKIVAFILYEKSNHSKSSINIKKDRHIYYFDKLQTKLLHFIDRIDATTNRRISLAFINSCLIKSYSMELYWEREKIFYFDQYNIIQKVLKKDGINQSEKNEQQVKLLLINAIEKETSKIYAYYVRPYTFQLDDTSLSYYLIGYAKKKSSTDNYVLSSFKLSRIIDCEAINEYFTYSANAQNLVNLFIRQYGPAYIPKGYTDPSEPTSKEPNKTNKIQFLHKEPLIKVVLSKDGYDLYMKRINRKRPIPFTEPKPLKSENKTVAWELTFNCSQEQILYYFFQFGKEAEITQPLELRETFVAKYKEALEKYTTQED